jgi:hypothetical protein
MVRSKRNGNRDINQTIDRHTAMCDNNHEALRGRILNRRAVEGANVLVAQRIVGPSALAGEEETPCSPVVNNSTPAPSRVGTGVRLYSR